MENSGILLIDDEIAYHGILRALLADIGRPIHCVSDGEEAMAAVAAGTFTLILLDIEMPGIDGYDVTRMIRARGGWAAACPIIAFTSLHPDDGEAHFLNAGMNGHLPKPFGVAEVAMIMRRWIGIDLTGQGDGPSESQLTALLGEDAAGRMVHRFYVALQDAVAAIDAGEDARSFGHRMGGLAGTLGFGMLSTAWLALQDGAGEAWPTVRALTVEAIARHTIDRSN